jgi:hypothetical protein
METDLSPKIIILLTTQGGNNFLGSLLSTQHALFPSFATLKECIKDYCAVIEGKIYIGIREGFLPPYHDWCDARATINSIQCENGRVIEIQWGTPTETLNAYINAFNANAASWLEPRENLQN